MNLQEMKKLITKAKKGDKTSFGELYSVYAKELYRFAVYTLKNPLDAEDAVQNAALTAYRKIGDLKKDESFKSWFFKILYTECMKIAGEKSRKFEISCEDMSLYEKPAHCDNSEIDIQALLCTLPEKEKSIVILSVFEDYTSKEIAEILGMKAGSVRSSLSRSLTKLRKQIEGAENE